MMNLKSLATTLVILGIIFGEEDQLIGYSFIGIGVMCSIICAFKSRNPKTQSHRTGGA